jgi:hypothetical protein
MKMLIILAASILSFSSFAADKCTISEANINNSFGNGKLSERVIDALANKGFGLSEDPSHKLDLITDRIVRTGIMKEAQFLLVIKTDNDESEIFGSKKGMFISNKDLDNLIENVISSSIIDCK